MQRGSKYSGSQQGKNSFLDEFKAANFQALADRFTSLQEVGQAIKKVGLESSELIFGIDYTKSNLHQGTDTFNGRSLHAIDAKIENPYQTTIRILGSTLEEYDDDGEIPAYGFGDIKTKDKDIFVLSEGKKAQGYKEVLAAYNKFTPNVKLSGPTNFAPLILKTIEIVCKKKCYHILVIIADGQVTDPEETIDAIVEASNYPISIIMVGVGDGPWDQMNEFDDQLPERKFDNFQFVEFSEVMHKGGAKPEQYFALHALMEIPDQYQKIKELGLLRM